MLVSVIVLHHLLVINQDSLHAALHSPLIARHVIPDPVSAAHDSCTAQLAFNESVAAEFLPRHCCVRHFDCSQSLAGKGSSGNRERKLRQPE